MGRGRQKVQRGLSLIDAPPLWDPHWAGTRPRPTAYPFRPFRPARLWPACAGCVQCFQAVPFFFSRRLLSCPFPCRSRRSSVSPTKDPLFSTTMLTMHPYAFVF